MQCYPSPSPACFWSASSSPSHLSPPLESHICRSPRIVLQPPARLEAPASSPRHPRTTRGPSDAVSSWIARHGRGGTTVKSPRLAHRLLAPATYCLCCPLEAFALSHCTTAVNREAAGAAVTLAPDMRERVSSPAREHGRSDWSPPTSPLDSAAPTEQGPLPTCFVASRARVGDVTHRSQQPRSRATIRPWHGTFQSRREGPEDGKGRTGTKISSLGDALCRTTRENRKVGRREGWLVARGTWRDPSVCRPVTLQTDRRARAAAMRGAAGQQ